MDWYLVFKFIHVAAAVSWVGGVVATVLVGAGAARAGNRGDSLKLIEFVLYLAPRLFIPGSVIVLIAGVVAVFLGRSWSELWIIIGLVGVVATFCTGNFLIAPRGEKFVKMVKESGDSPAAEALGRDMLAIAKFDLVMLFVVIADMVLKPVPADWIVLLVMVVALVAGAVAFLLPLRGRAALPA